MISLNSFLERVKVFVSTYKWLLFPIIPIIIFIYIIFYIFYAQKNPGAQQKQQLPPVVVSQAPQPTEASQQPQDYVSPSEEAVVSPEELSPDQVLRTSIDQEANTIATGNLKFAQDESGGTNQNSYPGDDEVAEGSSQTITLPDGSIEYQYPSDDPNRPHMQIIKDAAVVFRRNNMSDTGISVTDYSDLLSNPEYTSQGSSYFGANAMIYAAPSKGIAITADQQTGEVYEQYLFPAMSVNDYLQKFGKDISAFTPAP